MVIAGISSWTSNTLRITAAPPPLNSADSFRSIWLLSDSTGDCSEHLVPPRRYATPSLTVII
jgi:hypothetical protein